MYSKATYITPYKTKIAHALRIPAKDLKSNMVYAILANAKIKPVDHDQYGTPLFSYYDMDTFVKSYPIIIDAYRKWQEDMIHQDVTSDLKTRKMGTTYSIEDKLADNTDELERRKEMQQASDELLRQQEIYFNDDNDDRLYESLFSKKVYFTESQIKNIVEKEKYIDNDFNEKWVKLPKDSEMYKLVDSDTSFRDECYSHFGIVDVAEVQGDTHYIAIFHGGLNGNGEWDKYLEDMIHIIRSIKGSYIIKLDVDVPDDVWNLTIGFEKEKLNEGAGGYQPEDSDAYFDTCYKISEELFKDLLKKIDKCYLDKDDNMIYTYLGIVNHLLQVGCLRTPVYYTNKDLTSKKPEGNPLGINIIKTCLKCYKYLESDKENRQGWKDFERYKEELHGQYHIFKMTMQTLNRDANVFSNYLYHLNESVNFVEPKKVLVVKEYLDNNFVRAAMPEKMSNGDIKNKAIVGYKGPDGQPAENMSIRQLFWKVQDHFQHIYADKAKRDTFLKQVIIDWYNKNISKEGLLSKNQY